MSWTSAPPGAKRQILSLSVNLGYVARILHSLPVETFRWSARPTSYETYEFQIPLPSVSHQGTVPESCCSGLLRLAQS